MQWLNLFGAIRNQLGQILSTTLSPIESYNPVPEVQLVDADKSNAYSGFAPLDEVAL